MIDTLFIALGIGILTTLFAFAFLALIDKFYSQVKNNKTVDLFESTVREHWITAIIGVVVFFLGSFYFKNIIVGLIASLVVALIPGQIFFYKRKNDRTNSLEQLGSGIALFTTSFMESKNIFKSIDVVSKRGDKFIASIFKTVYRELAFGKPMEKTFNTAAQKMGLAYGYIFLSLIKEANVKGDAIIPLLKDLEADVIQEQLKNNENDEKIGKSRLISMFLLIMPLPIYIFFSSSVPEMRIFILSDFGQILVALWIVAIIIWMFIERLVVES